MIHPRRWTLRSRLLAVFLLLTLIPSIGLTLVLTQSLTWAIDRWADPRVRLTFENAILVSRDTLHRIQNDLRQRWALSREYPEITTWRKGLVAGEDSGQDPGRLVGNRLSLDFILLLPDADPGSVPLGVVTRDPLVAPPTQLSQWGEGTMTEGAYLRGQNGELAFARAVSGNPGEPGPILVVGIYLDPTFYAKLEDLSTALSRHRQTQAAASINKVAVYFASSLFVILAGLVSVLLADRLSKSLSRPVEFLADGMNRVAHGSLDIRLIPEGSPEMKTLMTSFNTMTAELGESKSRLARAERAAAWQDAARRIAHEIRNPLQPITLALHRIEKTVADDPARLEKVRGSIHSILEEVEALKKLASGFAEFAKMPDPEPERTELVDYLKKSILLFEYPGISIRLEGGDRPVWVRIDRLQFRQVLTNLVKNAAEAMPEGGRVTLRILENEGTMRTTRIHVEDQGPGIPAERVRELFQPYVTTKADGTGLGLAIVERIVSSHGGSLSVEPGPEGGARFIVELPSGSANPEKGDAL